MRRLRVAYVITEPRDRIDARARRDQRLEAGRLEAASGGEVVPSHYTDPLPDADVVVLSGSSAPWSAHEPAELERLGASVAGAALPVLGICAGLQLLARWSGARVAAMGPGRVEHGFRDVDVLRGGGLFEGVPPRVTVYQEHTDEVVALPEGWELLATSSVCLVQAAARRGRPWWGTQFHPEWHDAAHPHGRRILENFFALAAPTRAAPPAMTEKDR